MKYPHRVQDECTWEVGTFETSRHVTYRLPSLNSYLLSTNEQGAYVRLLICSSRRYTMTNANKAVTVVERVLMALRSPSAFAVHDASEYVRLGLESLLDCELLGLCIGVDASYTKLIEQLNG